MVTAETIIGIDVSQASPDLWALPEGTAWRCHYTEYMATLAATRCNPTARACYERLLATGKPQKVALTAAMRTLLTFGNAIIKSNTPWQNPIYPAA